MSCTLFMTSSLGCVGWDEEKNAPCPQEFDDANGLLTLLEERWRSPARFLFVASYEGGGQKADEYAAVMAQEFTMSGLPIANVTVLDGRNPEVVNVLEQFDVIFLSGGHVPTENRFFRAIGLGEAIRQFEGIVIGESAGSMNCADVVYASPEESGEAVDPSYELYIEGLGLTNVNIMPHMQKVWATKLDGFDLFEEILLRDSFERPFYALPDGSFILQEEGLRILFGPGYWIDCGQVEEIGAEGEGRIL